MKVLLDQAVLGIDHDDGDLATLNGLLGAHDAVFLDPFLDLPRSPDTSRIDENEFFLAMGERRIDSVSCGARHFAFDNAALTEDLVHEGRLAHVGPADDGDAQSFGILVLRNRWEDIEQLVVDLADAQAMVGANGHRITQPQRKELNRKFLAFGVIALVRDQQDGFVRAPQEFGDLLVHRRNPCRCIDNEEDRISFGHGDVDLLADQGGVANRRIRFEAARVDQPVLPVLPLNGGVEAVAGCSRNILDDGLPLAGEAIEQRRFPNVGPADDGDGRQLKGRGFTCRLPLG